MTPVLVPKRHFWEKDNVQMMQVSPAITGFAAPCPCPSTSPCPTPGVAPISPTGGAAQMTPNREIIKQKVKERMETRKGRATGGAAGVRGYW
jgi:hypothetical protein